MKLAILVLVLAHLFVFVSSHIKVTSCDTCKPGKKWGKIEFNLRCINERSDKKGDKKDELFCVCHGKGHRWKIESDTSFEYEGCIVTRFGPCGEKKGLKLKCERGLTCHKDSYCIDKESAEDGECEINENCKSNLKCNKHTFKCIKPNSGGIGKECGEKNDCKNDLKCNLANFQCIKPNSGDIGRNCSEKNDCLNDLKCNKGTSKCITPNSTALNGTCGEKHDCKDGLECVPGNDPNIEPPSRPKPFFMVCGTLSGEKGKCFITGNCKKGLICNRGIKKCIKRKSTEEWGKCKDNEDCQDGLKCVKADPQYAEDWVWNDYECSEKEFGANKSFKSVVENAGLILICLKFVY